MMRILVVGDLRASPSDLGGILAELAHGTRKCNVRCPRHPEAALVRLRTSTRGDRVESIL